MKWQRSKPVVRWTCTAAFIGLTTWWVASGWYQLSCWTKNNYICTTMGIVDWARGPVVAEPPENGFAALPLITYPDAARWLWSFKSGRLQYINLGIEAGRTVELVNPWVVEVPIWPAVLSLGIVSCRWWWIKL